MLVYLQYYSRVSYGCIWMCVSVFICQFGNAFDVYLFACACMYFGGFIGDVDFLCVWQNLSFDLMSSSLQNGHVKCLYSNINEMATNTK